jgi:hypothetical protein
MWYLHWFWYALTHGQNLIWNTSILSISFLFGWLTVLVNATSLYNALWVLNFALACWLGQQLMALFSVHRWLNLDGRVELDSQQTQYNPVRNRSAYASDPASDEPSDQRQGNSVKPQV